MDSNTYSEFVEPVESVKEVQSVNKNDISVLIFWFLP
jgi:hypothetical protein